MKTFFRSAAKAIALGFCQSAVAATITVTSPSDSGPGTLRAALASASPGDFIQFAVNGEIPLTSGELVIDKNITIDGPGANELTVSRATGASSFRIFHVTPAHTVTIQGLTITNGYANVGFVSGGGIYNDHSNVTVNKCIVTRNSAHSQGGFSGGGIGNNAGFSGSASLTVNDSIITDNNVEDGITFNIGGGIFNFALGGGTGTVTINNSTISNNRAIQGGGLYSDGTNNGHSNVTINNTTFSNNSAQQDGGAIFTAGDENGDASLIVTSSTFSGNSAGESSSDCNCNFAAAIENHGDAGANDGIVELANVIFQASPQQRNITNQGGVVVSHGYNLTNDAGVLNTSGGIGGLNAPTDQINTDPILDPAGPQNNGGPAPTVALLSGSPAINSGDPNTPARDQRYYLRDGLPDRGAFESAGTIAPLASASRKTHGAAGAFDVNLPLSGNAGIECRTGGNNGDHQVVLNFATPVTAAGASVTSGVGSVTSTSVNGSQVTLSLTGVANAQQIVVTVSDVNDGANLNDVNLPIHILLGDVNGNGGVSASDVSLAKSRLGQPLDVSNFRADVNVNGGINATDVSLVKSHIGTGVP